MNLFQLLIIGFLFITFYRLIKKVRDRQVSQGLFLIWFVLWLAVGVLVIFPSLMSRMAELSGIGRGVDLAIYIAIIILLYTQFKLYHRLEEQDKRISHLVRKIAINNAQKNANPSRDNPA
ncbi:TPA: DUF2304 domain-containing protein [Candidatus Falkowbacteria bacterium]|nr:DUF2304 domain-containing protein [Candidatus Falkowbacteria bacterium]